MAIQIMISIIVFFASPQERDFVSIKYPALLINIKKIVVIKPDRYENIFLLYS